MRTAAVYGRQAVNVIANMAEEIASKLRGRYCRSGTAPADGVNCPST